MPDFLFSLKPPLSTEKKASCLIEVFKGGEFQHSYHIPFQRIYSALQDLVTSGRLVWEKKPLVVDFFTKGKIEGEMALFGSRKILIEKAAFIGRGPPHFLITPPFLYFFDLQVDFVDLKPSPKGEIIAYLPELHLKDSLGGFAQLFFEGPEKERMMWEKDLLEVGYQKRGIEYFCSPTICRKALVFLLECGWTIKDYFQKRLVLLGEPTLELSSHHRQFLLKGEFGTHGVRIEDIKSFFHPLNEHQVALLPPKYDKLLTLEGELVSGGIRFKTHQMQEIEELQTLPIEIHESAREIIVPKKTFIPSSFVGQLRPYQQTGVDWLSHLYRLNLGGILADEMGLGKTVQVLAFLSTLIHGPHLIVVPATLLFNWQLEIKRFLPHAKVNVYHGTQRMLENPSIVLTSYGMLKRDHAVLKTIEWETVSLDEAQMIKNEKTQAATAARSLKAHFRLSITGTPIENRRRDLESQFHFLHLAPTVSSSFFLLRRKKEEVAKDLPPKIEQVIWLEMGPKEQDYYETFHASARSSLLKKVSLEGESKHRMEILETILRLRQLCCHPSLTPFLHDVPDILGSKMEVLLMDIEEAIEEGRKVLIYSQFTQMLTLLGNTFKERGWNFCQLTGETKNRGNVVEIFQGGKIPLFLLSLKAGGVGLNLTVADTVILYEPWWNRAVENQAIDRAHRIGQQKRVLVKRYLLKNTIEEKIEELKEKKQKLLDDLFEASEEELMTLLR
ncbi:MAG: DEAD/DEAH box helicase [Chlamydiia bacterium]|nr:DEAD/DEAH box helicase [Chlamydiia bacterium]